MATANQIKRLIYQVENKAEYKISYQKAKRFFSETQRLVTQDKTLMPPFVRMIRAYVNLISKKQMNIRNESKSWVLFNHKYHYGLEGATREDNTSFDIWRD